MDRAAVLQALSFGHRVAEEEGQNLTRYFVETDQWRRLLSGSVDIVYGAKGAGKSALYSLLLARRDELFSRSVVVTTAENPRGTPAFRDIVADPPASEDQFRGLWKLYFLSLLSDVLEEFGVDGPQASELKRVLEREGLRKKDRSLAGLLRSVRDYVRAHLVLCALEGGLTVDPVSGLPSGLTGKIVFREPSSEERTAGFYSVDQLLTSVDSILGSQGTNVWILLDRLDVAFAESPALEERALRALFRVYLDMLGLSHVHLKIFLRTDVWSRITQSGFREASHITRSLTIRWDRPTLLNLVVSRAIQNESVRGYYGVSRDDVLASVSAQEDFFYGMCPRQIDIGPSKLQTFDWLLSRTRDGTKQTAPRELIHLLNSLREVQVRRVVVGDAEPEGKELFARASFKEALSEVSSARVEQTLFAEYPWLKERISALRGEKTLQSADTLARVWNIPEAEAAIVAQQLVDVGFFEPRGSKERPEYWAPFLYRDALDLVQGAAD